MRYAVSCGTDPFLPKAGEMVLSGLKREAQYSVYLWTNLWWPNHSRKKNDFLYLCSAFILSNETVNIWSHLLGLIYFTLLQFEDNIYFLPDHQGSIGDHMTFTIMNLCFQVMITWPSPSWTYQCVHVSWVCMMWRCRGVYVCVRVIVNAWCVNMCVHMHGVCLSDMWN